MSEDIKNVLVAGRGYLLPIAVRSLLNESHYRHKYLDFREIHVDYLRKLHDLEMLIISILRLSAVDEEKIIGLREAIGEKPLLVVSMDVEEEQMINLIRQGVKGLIVEDAEIPLIPKAVKALHNGELWCPRNLFNIVLQSFQDDEQKSLGPLAKKSEVSNREAEILKEMALGKTNKEIASTLNISYSTVVNHSNNIYRKLKVNNRTSAIRIANERNLLEDR